MPTIILRIGSRASLGDDLVQSIGFGLVVSAAKPERRAGSVPAPLSKPRRRAQPPLAPGRMVDYDLPWNPNRLEQRFGRIHRIGQTEVCHLWNLLAEETREGDVYKSARSSTWNSLSRTAAPTKRVIAGSSPASFSSLRWMRWAPPGTPDTPLTWTIGRRRLKNGPVWLHRWSPKHD